MNNENDTNEMEFIIDANSNESTQTESQVVESSKVSEELEEKNKSTKSSKKSSGVEKRLWNVAKKYKSLFDKGEVPQIAESEEDRQEVADAYLEIETKRHRQLDSRVYQSLTKMQRTRDAKVALEGTTEKDRLRMIAWEVKIRLQPIIFTAGDSTIEMDIFNLHDTGSDVRIIEGTNQELLIEDNIVEGEGIAILDDLPLRRLTKEQKLDLRQQIIKKFAGRDFSKDEFNKEVSSLEADLISLMAREKEILLVKQPNARFLILSAQDELVKDIESVESESLVITPKLAHLRKVVLQE